MLLILKVSSVHRVVSFDNANDDDLDNRSIGFQFSQTLFP